MILTVPSRDPGDMLTAFSEPGCKEGGLVWYGVWGRIHGAITLSADRTQEFEICLTGGLADSVYIWWDSHRDYWMPLGFQQWHCEFYILSESWLIFYLFICFSGGYRLLDMSSFV